MKEWIGAEELRAAVEHEVRGWLGNPSGIKQRYYPTLGFGAFESARRFCETFDEVNQFLHPRARMAEFVSLSEQWERFLERIAELQVAFQAM